MFDGVRDGVDGTRPALGRDAPDDGSWDGRETAPVDGRVTLPVDGLETLPVDGRDTLPEEGRETLPEDGLVAGLETELLPLDGRE